MNPFNSLQNIQKAFALTRIYLILITIVLLALGGYAIYSSYQFAEAQRSKIYVLENDVVEFKASLAQVLYFADSYEWIMGINFQNVF